MSQQGGACSRPACSPACASTGSAKYAALLLPDEAIGTDQTNKFVYVVGDDGTVARRNVKLGRCMDGLRVVREGVAAGEWVITKGMQRARPAPERDAQARGADRVRGAGASLPGKAQE